MKTLIGWCVAGVLLLAFTEAAPQFATARSTYLTTFSLLEPSCVVTGGKLFVNGIEDRTLNWSERHEFETYQTLKNNYVKLVKRAIEKQLNRMLRNKERGESKFEVQPLLDERIKAPEKPSFCSDEVTTQYAFSGCIVQNNKVIINGAMVRELSSDEIKELKSYLAKLEEFKKWAEKTVEQKMNEAFRGMHSIKLTKFEYESHAETSEIRREYVEKSSTEFIVRARLVAHSSITIDHEKQQAVYQTRDVVPMTDVKWTSLQRCCVFLPPIIIFGLTIFNTQLGVYSFWHLYDHQIIAAIVANYMQILVLTNIWAMVKSQSKNCPQYQLHRLGISSSWMAEYKNEYTRRDSAVKRYWKWKLCKKCQCYAPLRSVHCEDCGQCSLRNDHHCYLFGVCIGVANMRHFIVCTYWMMCGGAWGASTFLYLLAQIVFNHEGIISQKYLHPILSQFSSANRHRPVYPNEVSSSLFNESFLMLLTSTMVFFFSMLAFICGGFFFFMQMYYTRQGVGMREADSIAPVIRGDDQGTTFVNRLQFYIGNPLCAHIFIPPQLLQMIWPEMADVEWSENYVRSIVTQPFKANLTIKEGTYER
ncbi:unnamed protein product, partial [Mesorhabditis belari]|uniref:Palmitoyltransferase n=1 Tax=Mesorhabditis belari TaxID=2138241 RepID=A0AAF3EVG0_9BILA